LNIPLAQYWDLLVDYLRVQRWRVAALAVLLFGNIGLQLLNPQLMRWFIDTASSGSPLDRLTLVGALFFVLALAQQGVSVLATYTGETVAWRATNLLRYDLARHCLHLDMSFHNTRTPGELIERIDGDVNTLSNFFSQFVIRLVGNSILLLGILCLLFLIDWRVGLVIGVFVAITMMVLLRLRNISVPHWKASSEAHAALFGFLEERLGGTQDIRSNGATAYVMRRFYELIRTAWRADLRARWMINIMINSTFVLFATGSTAAFVSSSYLYQSGLITIGTVYLIFHYTEMLMQPIQQITQQLEDLQRAGAGIVRVRELTNTSTRLLDGPGAALAPGALGVEFDGVRFGYDAAEPVIHDLSFTLRPGTVIGLLGRTGSGKTTLTRLLTRLYDASHGSIRLAAGDSAIDIRQLRLADIPRHVGMVTQNVQLFNAAVRDNLTFFDQSIPDERILAVLHELGLIEWFRALPDGLDTVLASGGGGLSAGEAQLLAFTRIFLKDPGLVILDEASSRLDPATEQRIERAIDRLVEGRTAIIIAHRLQTVERADEIMILEDGRIHEYGSRRELALDQDSRFARLLRTGLEEVLA